jgi:glutamine phosphoribosylpyrophosphate amidotransferase
MSSAFDQRGQTVINQTNIASVGVGSVQNRLEVVEELLKLQAEIASAKDSQVIDESVAMSTQNQIQEAIIQTQKPEPNSSLVLDHLSNAKKLLQGLGKTAEIVERIIKIMGLIKHFF